MYLAERTVLGGLPYLSFLLLILMEILLPNESLLLVLEDFPLLDETTDINDVVSVDII